MKILNFIHGQFVPASRGGWLDNVAPATGEVYSLVAASTPEDVEAAVASGTQAFLEGWGESSREERVALMLKLAELMERDMESLARAESKDQGKPVSLAMTVDIPRAIENWRFFARYIEQLADQHWSGEMGENWAHYRPLGVVAAIVPWNLPLYLMTWKLAPALAVGNCVVVKPSELTPVTASMFCKLVQEAGLPPGVINVVHGEGAAMGDALTTDPRVRAVSFTGSTATGMHIHHKATTQAPEKPSAPKRVSLEMGGKNPNIVFADCDFERTVKTTLHSSFSNQGQVCTCGSRVFVERPLYDKFKGALLRAIPDFPQGALVSEGHLNKVLSYVSLAREEGGTILCGGERGEGPGFFMGPTVIEGLDGQSRVNREEIFGPVITLTPFDTEEEVIRSANAVDYGLGASIHTEDRERARRVARALEVGMVWVNNWMKRDLRTPFGGVKQSGLGREGGLWALQFYAEVKNICYS